MTVAVVSAVMVTSCDVFRIKLDPEMMDTKYFGWIPCMDDRPNTKPLHKHIFIN